MCITRYIVFIYKYQLDPYIKQKMIGTENNNYKIEEEKTVFIYQFFLVKTQELSL